MVPRSPDATPQSIQDRLLADVSERDVAVTQWERATFSSTSPEFDSGRLCTQSQNCSTGPEVYVLSDKGPENESTASDTDSFACEPRTRRRRLSLVWESNVQAANSFSEQQSLERSSQAGRRSVLVSQISLQAGASHPGPRGSAHHRDRDSDTESLEDGQSVFDGDAEAVSPELEPVREAVHARVSPAIRASLRSLDHVDVAHLFKLRAVVMKSPPKFVRGAYCAAMRVALEEIEEGFQTQSEERQCRGWKLFLLLPRMLLFRPPRGVLISSRECSGAARVGSVRRRRTHVDTLEKRAERAQMLVMMGEVSAGRQAPVATPPASAQGTRPPELRRSDNVFTLNHNLFSKTLKCARRGAAGGPSGMTVEHVKPILDSFRDTELFCQVAEHLARGEIPGEVLHVVRMGRMTALQKKPSGVRGIVAGDIVRRLVAKTIAQQIRVPVEVATAPFQFALSTRAGCECIAHALQAMTDAVRMIPFREWQC